MIEQINIFSPGEGNFLIRLLLAHLLADFAFQTRKMVDNKSWFSRWMLIHILIVALLTFLFTFSWKITLLISVTHWLIDSTKSSLQKAKGTHEHTLFLVDQSLHLGIILVIWAYKFGLFANCVEVLKWPFTDYKISLLILAYAAVIWPMAYLLKFALNKMAAKKLDITSNNYAANSGKEQIENAGKLIGQFERVIILTFVLLGQYAAIGFLITGKSIIRFADKNSELKSEYVLVGTMMSFGLCIITGLGTKWLLNC